MKIRSDPQKLDFWSNFWGAVHNGIPIVEQEKNVAVLDYLVSNNMTKKHSNPFKLGAINYFETLFSTSQFITIFFVLLSVFIAFSFTSDGRNRSISILICLPIQ